jgi:acetyl-CoA carboxylase biotin carboxyl carrier protein
MGELKIAARVEHCDDGSFLVRAPAVGVVDAMPAPGLYLNAMEGFLSLRVLGRRHVVLLPRGVQGRVTERFALGRSVPVEYDQPLLRLRAGASEASDEERRLAAEAAGAGAERDLFAVPSPSDGIFYRRASPDAPPYVEVGQAVARGSVLGLVEVMKSFNQILYGGPGLPERGSVAAILVDDTREVKFGQPLFRIKPTVG